jgi:hypothetical protein
MNSVKSTKVVKTPAQQTEATNTQLSTQSKNESTSEFLDLRTQSNTQRVLQEHADNSPQAKQLQAFQRMTHGANQTPQKNNNTGLPNQLKSGIESLSGMNMDHVKVNYNSDKTAQLNAHAYAQGSEIHIALGQEQHLPHEAWHVVQQAQGRVKPTMQMKSGIPVNDDVGLEHEADVMGAQALRAGTSENSSTSQLKSNSPSPYQRWTTNYKHHYGISATGVIQGAFNQVTLEDDIASHASSIRSAGGTTNEAFIINTAGEHGQIFIKFTDSDFAVEAARLAAIFQVSTPRAIAINKETIREKISELNDGYGRILIAKPHAIAFEFVNGTSVTDRSKARFNADSFQQIGAIAAFDMLIGKTDLFENFEQFNPEQENYNNVKVSGANLIDIDLSASAITASRLQVVRGIIENPAQVHRFVKNQIGGLFEMKDETLSLLQIQRSFLETIGRINAAQADGITQHDVQNNIRQLAELAPLALGAIGTVDVAIEIEQQRRILAEQEQERRNHELAEQRRLQRLAAEQRRQEQLQQAGGCCYLTTACCEYYGFADDCEYLTVLRRFRDQWLLQQPNGQALVQIYYDKSPKLLAVIHRRHDEEEIFKLILNGIIMAVEMIQQNEMKRAAEFYQTMSLSLEHAFARDFG